MQWLLCVRERDGERERETWVILSALWWSRIILKIENDFIRCFVCFVFSCVARSKRNEWMKKKKKNKSANILYVFFLHRLFDYSNKTRFYIYYIRQSAYSIARLCVWTFFLPFYFVGDVSISYRNLCDVCVRSKTWPKKQYKIIKLKCTSPACDESARVFGIRVCVRGANLTYSSCFS